jgi:V-type H+-transporting ATPase subunit a
MGEKYEIPLENIDEKIAEVESKIKDTRGIVQMTQEELKKYLVTINSMEDTDVSVMKIYKWFITKEKLLYSNLNMLKSGNKLLVGLFWLPDSNREDLHKKISDIREDRNISGPQIWKRENHKINPPTYFRLNEFTASFQEITNTYGIPMYKEVNPSLFGIVTFPFLFGVMFGDIGHGFLLFLFGTFLCLGAEVLKGGALGGIVQARYLIVLMGVFATFHGIMYNDFMSLPVELGT